MVAGHADGAHQGPDRFDLIEPLRELGAGPGGGPVDCGWRPFRGTRSRELGQPTDDVVCGDTAPADRRVDGAAVVVEPGTVRRKTGAILRWIGQRGFPEIEGPFQLVEDGALVGLVAVQLEAGVTDLDFVQAPLDDLERCHLLGDEQDPPVGGDRFGDQIRDRLRLAGAWRALNHQIAAVLDVDDGQRLGAVRVHDLVGVRHVEVVVEMIVVGDRRVGFPETLCPEQGLDECAIGRRSVLGPGRSVEILVDEQLVERKEAKVDRVVVHGPSISGLHRGGDPAEVVVHVDVFRFGKRGRRSSKSCLSFSCSDRLASISSSAKVNRKRALASVRDSDAGTRINGAHRASWLESDSYHWSPPRAR